MSERCDGCRFYLSVEPGPPGRDDGVGICQRYPPMIVPPEDRACAEPECNSAMPDVAAHDWCGEYQPGEGAVVEGEAPTVRDLVKELARTDQHRKDIEAGLRHMLAARLSKDEPKAVEIVRRLADANKGEDDVYEVARLAAEYFGEGDE